MSAYFDCYRAIRQLRVFMTFIGLIPANVRFRKLQIVIVFIFVATISLLRLWHSEQSSLQSDSELSRVVDTFSLILLWTVHIVLLVETSFKIKQFDNIILQFENLENRLRDHHVQASSSALKYRALKKYSILVLQSMEIVLLIWILNLDNITWIRWVLSTFSEISLRAKLVEFLLLAILLSAVQQDLCSAMTKVVDDVQSTLHSKRKCLQDPLEALISMGSIRIGIWMVCKMIEDLCEWSLIGMLLKMFCDLTFTAYWVYILSLTIICCFFAVCLIFLLVRGFMFIACCWICNCCEDLENEFISKLPLDGRNRADTHISLITKDLSMQLFHKRIKFAAGDIIALNFRTLGEVIFSAVTYVVILIQFRMAVPSTQ